MGVCKYKTRHPTNGVELGAFNQKDYLGCHDESCDFSPISKRTQGRCGRLSQSFIKAIIPIGR